jgi:hypothetical protein
MYIQRKDITLIGEIMDEFPDALSYQLDSESQSGIGSILKLTITTKINGRLANVTFEISGVENW